MSVCDEFIDLSELFYLSSLCNLQVFILVLEKFSIVVLSLPAAFLRENQILAVDESKVFCPPSKLHVPDENAAAQNESAILIPESSDLSSSESSSPTYSHDSPRPDRGVDARDQEVGLTYLVTYLPSYLVLFFSG